MRPSSRQSMGASARTWGNRPGQAAVEFSLVFIVLVALIYGIMEISRLIFINAELENAAREASRYASRHPFVSANDLRNNVISSKLTLIDINSPDLSVGAPAFPNGGVGPFYPVEVTVSYRWTSMVNIMPDMSNLRLDPMGPLNLRATSTSLIEGR